MKSQLKNPRISLILPVYNESQFLDQCFQSALNQTYRNFEVLVSDNASTDDTWAIVQRYQQKYPDFFKIHHFEKEVHAFVNLKKCLEMASGELVYHYGGDDYLLTNDFLEKAVKPFEKENVGAHITRLDYIDTKTEATVAINPPDYVNEYIHLGIPEFCAQYVQETSRDDLFVAFYPIDLFKKIFENTYRFSIESAGWWVVMQVMLSLKQDGKEIVFDLEKNCLLKKRVNRQPVGKVQSAAGASANRFDPPWFRFLQTLKYSFQTAFLIDNFFVRIQVLWILLFHQRSKLRGMRKYLAPGIAFFLGALVWARLYMRSRDLPVFEVIVKKIRKMRSASI